MRAGLAAAVVGAAATVALTPAIGATADARPSADGPWVVRDEGHGRSVIAGYRTWRGAQNLRALIRAWGPPVRLARPGGSAGRGCVAIWRRPALRVNLANLGVLPDGATACSPRYGRVQFVSTTGPRWRTDRGLRVGDDTADIVAAYPDALDRAWFGAGRVWLLRPYETPCIGECDTQTVMVSAILAQVRAGRVTRFHAPVGAAGE